MGATLASLESFTTEKISLTRPRVLLESERIYRQTLGDKNRYLAFNLNTKPSL
jgi:hypothetical protein